MIALLLAGEFQVFVLVLAAMVFSMVLHQYAWGWAATWMGDDTPARSGRLTLDPAVHFDLVGLLMLILIGFGFFKPVPTDVRNFRHAWSLAFVAAFSVAVFVVIAALAINGYAVLTASGVIAPDSTAAKSLVVLAQLNLILLAFNLLPIGQTPGHFILAYLLPSWVARPYVELNARYGLYVLFGLIALNLLGVPVFQTLFSLAAKLVPYLTLV